MADNTAAVGGPNCRETGGGELNSLGWNLSNNANCQFDQPTDIQNSANISLGLLADNGGPTETLLPDPTSDAIDNGSCTTTVDQRGYGRPQGSACDIGSVEVRQGANYPLCANPYTGAISSSLDGQGCAAWQNELVVPGDVTFCINRWTGKISWYASQPCPPSMQTHTLPDDGDLLSCVSSYTGANRWVLDHSQCNRYEVANTIPATP